MQCVDRRERRGYRERGWDVSGKKGGAKHEEAELMGEAMKDAEEGAGLRDRGG